MLEIGTKIYGFTIKNIRDIPNKHAQLIEMIYSKTNTELCWYKSSEQNKLFAIAFKTLPKDDTGVFHILEHSVLCGSEKYPIKEPFVELLKSSMNTFLNAMTFSDKTLYPVSSRVEQDFLNLTSVYLDAVFAPKILTNPNIFYQEGWHYEFDDKKLIYNGVVFNEMKGAMSSVDNVVNTQLQKILFPNNSYGYVSGGDPEAIPTLTYDQFVQTYNENYHPSNARIYLDGDIPLEKVLKMLDEYLCKFDCKFEQKVLKQEPISCEKTIYYESNEDNLNNKAYLTLGKIIGKYDDKVKLLATHVLCDLLGGTNDSPIKKAILNNQLGEDVSIMVNDGVYQPWLVLQIQNMKNENSKKIIELIKSTINDLLNSGLDNNMLMASINNLAFRIKEMQEPQGLIRCINALDSWLYDGDPMLYMDYDESFKILRDMVEHHEFENLLTELFLDDHGLCILHALPSKTYGIELREKERIYLDNKLNSMNSLQIDECCQCIDSLTKWQQTLDTPEQINTLPVLDLSQISDRPSFIKTYEENVDHVKILRRNLNTNGIVYLNMYFSLTDYTLDELKELSFISKLFGNLPTLNYDVVTLQNTIKMNIGNLSFNVVVYSDFNQNSTCTPYLSVNCSVLKENFDYAKELIYEILTNTDFNQPERIKDMLLQFEIEAQQSGIVNGHSLAATCAQAHFSAQNAVSEVIYGYSYIQYLHEFVRDFTTKYDSLKSIVNNKLINTICASRLTISISEDTTTNINDLIHQFKLGTKINEVNEYKTSLPKKLGIKIPAQINYAVSSYHLQKSNVQYNGTFRLLSNIISLSYLWNVIRVQQGAYGAGMNVSRNGSMFTYSYRDPSPINSLIAYRNIADYVKQLNNSDENITKYIISTIAETEPLMSVSQQSKIEDMKYFSKFDYDCAIKERKELLSATKKQLLEWCPVLEQFGKESSICIVGYEDALNECKEENLEIFTL